MTTSCTCGGTAPGYPQHEPSCDLVTGGRQTAEEKAEELRERALQAAERADEDRWVDWVVTHS